MLRAIFDLQNTDETPVGPQEFTLQAQAGKVAVLGTTVDMATYGGKFPGPEIRVKEGQLIRLILHNGLEVPTSLYIHGLPSGGQSEWGELPVNPGESRTYEFQVPEGAAGTYMYGPGLPDNEGAKQEYSGLCGPFVVTGPEDKTIDAQEHVMVLKTLRIKQGADGLEAGLEGERYTLINGELSPIIRLDKPLQRVRLLNCSPEESYKVALEGHKLKVLGYGIGFLEAPEEVEAVELEPGERVDFLFAPLGTGVYDLVEMPQAGNGLPPTTQRSLASFVVADRLSGYSRVPRRLRKFQKFTGKAGPTIKLSNEGFEGAPIAEVGDIQIWELVNNGNVPQSLRMRGFPMLVKSRNGKPVAPAWRDTVSVAPAEKVVVSVAFTGPAGAGRIEPARASRRGQGKRVPVRVKGAAMPRNMQQTAPGASSDVKFKVLASGSLAALYYGKVGIIPNLEAMRQAYTALGVRYAGDTAFNFAKNTYCLMGGSLLNDYQLYPQRAYASQNQNGGRSLALYVGGPVPSEHQGRSYILELETGIAYGAVTVYDDSSGRQIARYSLPWLPGQPNLPGVVPPGPSMPPSPLPGTRYENEPVWPPEVIAKTQNSIYADKKDVAYVIKDEMSLAHAAKWAGLAKAPVVDLTETHVAAFYSSRVGLLVGYKATRTMGDMTQVDVTTRSEGPAGTKTALLVKVPVGTRYVQFVDNNTVLATGVVTVPVPAAPQPPVSQPSQQPVPQPPVQPAPQPPVQPAPQPPAQPPYRGIVVPITELGSGTPTGFTGTEALGMVIHDEAALMEAYKLAGKTPGPGYSTPDFSRITVFAFFAPPAGKKLNVQRVYADMRSQTKHLNVAVTQAEVATQTSSYFMLGIQSVPPLDVVHVHEDATWERLYEFTAPAQPTPPVPPVTPTPQPPVVPAPINQGPGNPGAGNGGAQPPTRPQPSQPVGQEVPFTVIDRGTYGNYHKSEPMVMIADNATEFNEVWLMARGGFKPTPAAPAIDFSKQAAIGFFLGEKPTAGYKAIPMRVIETSPGNVEIHVQIGEPIGAALQVISSPYFIISLAVGVEHVQIISAGKPLMSI
jgi:bilirubin oxidase